MIDHLMLAAVIAALVLPFLLALAVLTASARRCLQRPRRMSVGVRHS